MSEARSAQSGAAVRIPPPIALAVFVVAGFALRFAVALPLPIGDPMRRGLAIVALGTAIVLMAAALGLFRKTGQDPAPWKPSPEMIEGGVYRFTRNPMYLAMVLITAGFGFAFDNGWFLLLSAALAPTLYHIAIRHEEAYLAERFGEQYLDYKKRVRRWI